MSARTKTAGKERITKAALEAFARFGYDGAGVVQIAKTAGVSQPTLHYHFKSKRALWEAAMLKLGEDLKEVRAAQRDLYNFLPPLERLKATCTVLMEEAATRPVLGQIVLAEGQAGGERLDWLLRHILSDIYYDFLETIEACIEAGLIKRYKPSYLLMLLTGAAVTQFNVSPLIQSLFGENSKDRQNIDAFKAVYLDVLFAGLENNGEK